MILNDSVKENIEVITRLEVVGKKVVLEWRLRHEHRAGLNMD